jgi:hypothetical protein
MTDPTPLQQSNTPRWDSFVNWLDPKRLLTGLLTAAIIGGFVTFNAMQSSSLANAHSITKIEAEMGAVKSQFALHENTERSERAALRSELRSEAQQTRSEILEAVRELRSDVREASR